ncbi:hypothetical protein D3C73_1023950 [compost metagenome]
MPFGSTVDHCCLIIRAVNAGNCRKIDDTPISGIFPETQKDKKIRPKFRLAVPAYRVFAQEDQELIEDAFFYIEE